MSKEIKPLAVFCKKSNGFVEPNGENEYSKRLAQYGKKFVYSCCVLTRLDLPDDAKEPKYLCQMTIIDSSNKHIIPINYEYFPNEKDKVLVFMNLDKAYFKKHEIDAISFAAKDTAEMEETILSWRDSTRKV